jgi:precorrin-2 methylase
VQSHLLSLGTGGDFELVKVNALTLVDALDTLAIMGNKTEFARSVERVIEHLELDADVNVSVFETSECVNAPDVCLFEHMGSRLRALCALL